MAHLSGDGQRREGRGQIILLIGFTLAVTFVALALILNSAIYAENLATRSDTAAGGGPIEVRNEAESGVASLLAYVTAHNNTDQSAITDNLTTAIDEYSTLAGRQGAVDGRLSNVAVESVTLGSRLVQPDSGRNLTNRNGTANWTLARGIKARSLVFEVSDNRTTSDSCSPGGECFELTATSGGDVWRMAVYENATDVVVEIEGAGGATTTYSPPEDSPPVRIDLGAGTVNGHDVPALQANVPAPPYELGIVHGDLATGSFEVIVDDETIAASPDPDRYFEPGSSGSPRVTHAAYATAIRLTQRSERIVYNGTVRVAPGEWP
ncbi:hypothetical protein Hrd1104_09290 [Halorhabdus sp. CBA1104]|uniref:hypothetical protein n=1 Tax=Halorhabdus sp. CBA1104 TaxID=1380432 RepID=UPI0012B3BD6E|nr:hypothetical protein [Halorhabdus sp. CBA1104]QGN07481.1 hypothetical protein Hrd1104_09290 [Halorhabdus sp. CBA1104]